MDIIDGINNQDLRNPLLIELVLKNLLKYLTIKDLLNCRAVCSFWNNECCQLLKTRKLIDFSGSNVKSIYTFLQIMKPYFTTTTNNNLNLSLLPFGNFSIQIWDSESYRSRFTSLPDYTESFFGFYGPHINRLQISFNDFMDTMANPKFRDWFITSVGDNLESLELCGLSSYISDNSSQSSIFNDEENAQIFPNLSKLVMTDHFDEDVVVIRIEDIEIFEIQDDQDFQDQAIDQINPPDPDPPFIRVKKRFGSKFLADLLSMTPYLQSCTVNTFEAFESSLTSSTLEGGLKSLKNADYLNTLILKTYIDEEQLAAINSYKFKLSTFEFKCFDFDILRMSRELEKFLNCQAETLKDFTMQVGKSPPRPRPVVNNANVNFIDIDDFEVIFKIEFSTVMKHLVSLTLDSNSTMRPIEFVLYEKDEKTFKFPKLQKVCLRNNTRLNYYSCSTQEILIDTLELPRNFQDEPLFTNIMTNWTFLRKLKLVSPSHLILKTVFNLGGKSIEELEVELENDTEIESVLVGEEAILVPEDDRNNAAEGLELLDKVAEIQDDVEKVEIEKIEQTQKFIQDLKRLRKLIVSESDPSIQVNLTDLTIFSAIAKMTQLTSLTIKNSKVSNEGLKTLKENLPYLIFLDLDVDSDV